MQRNSSGTKSPTHITAPRSLVFAALLLTSTFPLFADQELEAEPALNLENGVVVLASQLLEPEEGNEVQLDEVWLDLLSDGSTSVRIHGSLEAGVTHRFAYFVNRDAGTFSTMEVPKSYVDTIVRESRDEGDTQGGPVAQSRMQAPDSLVPQQGIGPGTGHLYCDYEILGTISHFDPILIRLATTVSALRWRHDLPSNCLSRTWTHRTCWAAHPTPVGTHWSVVSCTSLDRNISLQHLQKTANGFYENWDFGSNTQRTWVQHFIQIDARAGISTYAMTGNDGGEASSLIFGVGAIGLEDLGCR